MNRKPPPAEPKRLEPRQFVTPRVRSLAGLPSCHAPTAPARSAAPRRMHG